MHETASPFVDQCCLEVSKQLWWSLAMKSKPSVLLAGDLLCHRTQAQEPLCGDWQGQRLHDCKADSKAEWQIWG